jgi:two-component system, NtrC family, response regulator AtoC
VKEPAKRSVLLVDDDEAVRTVYAALLEQAGIGVREAANGEEALRILATGGVDVMVTDLRMPKLAGMELLAKSLAAWPDVPVIVHTAHGSVPGAVEAMRLGATDFIEKLDDRAGLLHVVKTALERSERSSRPPTPALGDGHSIIGESLHDLRDAIRRAAAGTSKVFIRGENGTGKELVARAIHEASPRARGPFVAINCAAVPDTLFESELFGYVKGAFTGATKDKPGLIELAEGGSVFFDEIGEYSQVAQVKLLRVLQDGRVRRLNSDRDIHVDVRFIFATNRNVEEMVRRGQFREDLYYRLNVIPIRVPPLRERPADIPLLAVHFCTRAAAHNASAAPELDPAALALLAAQPWPGNVRQLENLIERLVVFADHPTITRKDVEQAFASDLTLHGSRRSELGPQKSGLSAARRDTERRELQEALRRANNNRALAARLLDVSRRTLYNKLEEYGLVHYPYADEAKSRLLEPEA